jgi:hypothetical protein
MEMCLFVCTGLTVSNIDATIASIAFMTSLPQPRFMVENVVAERRG